MLHSCFFLSKAKKKITEIVQHMLVTCTNRIVWIKCYKYQRKQQLKQPACQVSNAPPPPNKSQLKSQHTKYFQFMLHRYTKLSAFCSCFSPRTLLVRMLC